LTPNATARKATATTAEPGAARAPRRGREDGSCVRGHDAEVAGERVWIELRAKRSSAVPLGRFCHDALEGFAPVFFHAEGHGEGKEFLEHLRCLDHFIEA